MSNVIVVRKATDVGIDLIKKFENFSPSRYLCPAKFWTIGWGHEILPGEKFDEPISEEVGLDILHRDLLIAERSVCRLISVPLEDWQYDALVSWTFNLGGRRLQISTMRKRVNEQAHGQVPPEMRRWIYAGTKSLSGLIKRRRAEAALYTGVM